MAGRPGYKGRARRPDPAICERRCSIRRIRQSSTRYRKERWSAAQTPAKAGAFLNLPAVPGGYTNVLIDPFSLTIYAINDAGYLLSSTDGGSSWTTKRGPWSMNSTLLAVDAQHPNTIYVSSPNPGVEDAFVAKLDGTGATVWPPCSAGRT